jgi:hypothetical protein
MFAAATDFHHIRLYRIFTVFAAVLFASGHHAITDIVLTLMGAIVCHKSPSLSGLFSFSFMLELGRVMVKVAACRQESLSSLSSGNNTAG